MWNSWRGAGILEIAKPVTVPSNARAPPDGLADAMSDWTTAERGLEMWGKGKNIREFDGKPS